MSEVKTDRPDFQERHGGFKKSRRKVCIFCTEDKAIDYKDVSRLRKFVSERGKILPRRVTGNCAYHQRHVTIAIKRARQMALLPYTTD